MSPKNESLEYVTKVRWEQGKSDPGQLVQPDLVCMSEPADVLVCTHPCPHLYSAWLAGQTAMQNTRNTQSGGKYARHAE